MLAEVDITIGDVIIYVLAGLVIGVIARALLPGRQSMSILMTIVIGVIAAVVGGLLWELIFPDNDGIALIGSIIVGVVLVWLYAAIRPRYGPGPKAAILAGLFGWVLLNGFWYVYNLAWEIFPQDMVTISTVWGFFELPIATLVGAWLYREGPAVDARAL